MKKIYILLMHTNTIPSKLVKTFTRYKYSHVAIALEKECNVIYSFGRKKLNSILNGGFTAENKNGEFFKKFNKTKCKIYEIEIDDEKYKRLEKLIEEIKINEDDYKYDFIGLIPRFLGIPITIKNKYVCSYFIAYLLQEAKIHDFNKNVCLIKPKDFENIDGFKEIYDGYYVSY